MNARAAMHRESAMRAIYIRSFLLLALLVALAAIAATAQRADPAPATLPAHDIGVIGVRG